MLKLNLDKKQNSPSRVLCLGAHCDDIEIGCGGTILKLINSHGPLEFYWVVFGSNTRRANEASESARAFLADAKKKNILIKNFKDGFLPYNGGKIKELFEKVKRSFQPDLILTHYRDDLHQDHRLVSDLTWNTFRDHLILEYEIPKYDGDLGSPNMFVHLDESLCRTKVGHILGKFKTQQTKDWFTEDTFFSLLRLRGIESRSPSKYAEAFYCRKLVL